MGDPEDIGQLLAVRVMHADYLAARGRAARVLSLERPVPMATGVLQEVGSASQAGGFESFAIVLAIRDACAAQGLYRVEIEGLPVHALLLVPSARAGDVSEYCASFSRQPG